MVAACLNTCLVVMTPEIIGVLLASGTLRTRRSDRVGERLLHLARERERSARRGAGDGTRHPAARHRAIEGAFPRQLEVNAEAGHAHVLEGQRAVSDAKPAGPVRAVRRKLHRDGNLQTVPQHEALPPLRNGAAGVRALAHGRASSRYCDQPDQHSILHRDLLWCCERLAFFCGSRRPGLLPPAGYSPGNKGAATGGANTGTGLSASLGYRFGFIAPYVAYDHGQSAYGPSSITAATAGYVPTSLDPVNATGPRRPFTNDLANPAFKSLLVHWHMLF